ncbi:hypothetical protein EMG21_30220 [Klebsiella pneumoniae]|nr:hypothetical protein EMG21_30220 [Klebsiella pneumoniae]
MGTTTDHLQCLRAAARVPQRVRPGQCADTAGGAARTVAQTSREQPQGQQGQSCGFGPQMPPGQGSGEGNSSHDVAHGGVSNHVRVACR